MKKIFLLALIFFGIFNSGLTLSSCTKDNYNMANNIANKILAFKIINIKGINLNLSLHASNTIDAIENTLQLSAIEKSKITSITSLNNILKENIPTDVTFKIDAYGNTTNVTRPVVINQIDNSTTKNLKVFDIHKYNNKYYENTSNGLYYSIDCNEFTKINFNYVSKDIVVNSIYFNTYFYILTTKGLYISVDKTMIHFTKIIFLNDSAILNDSNINDIWINGYNMYIASNNGLYICDIFEKNYDAKLLIQDNILKISNTGQLFAWSINALFISYDKYNFNLVTNDFTIYNLYLDNDLLYLCTNKGLFFANSKFSWIKYYHLLINYNNDIAVFDIENILGIMYVATQSGLYYSIDHVNFISELKINNNSIFLINVFNNVMYLIINSLSPNLNNDSLGILYYQL